MSNVFNQLYHHFKSLAMYFVNHAEGRGQLMARFNSQVLVYMVASQLPSSS